LTVGSQRLKRRCSCNGGRDRRVPLTFARTFAESIPRAHLIAYSDVGHVPMEELPEETARDAEAFLESLEGPR
jgi:pimeloyl-ACP methyl ester carboxylesterase